MLAREWNCHIVITGGDELSWQRDGDVRVARACVLQHALGRLLPEQHVVLLQVPAVPGTLPEGVRQVLVVVIERRGIFQ